MNKIIIGIIVLAGIGTYLAMNQDNKPTDTPTVQKDPSQKVWTIGMSQCTVDEPWRAQMNTDIENAAKQHDNIELIIKVADDDTRKQQSQVKEFVEAGIDLLIISPKEAQPLTKPVADAMDAGIPVIVLDRRVNGDNYTVHIGPNNKKIGLAAGKWIKQYLGGKGKVVELKGLMTSTPAQDRHSGFREGIEGSGIEVIFEQDIQWKEPLARKEMDSALARFDSIDLVYGHNDPAAHGAYQAAKALGREKDIKFVGIDALGHEGMKYVKEGKFVASFEYPTGGAKAIEVALEILKGNTVPKEIVLDSKVYTPENIEKGGDLLQ